MNQESGIEPLQRRMVSYEEGLSLAHRVTEPAIRQVIHDLSLPRRSRGLDVGCGVGRHTLWLAETIGNEGHVTGLDISIERLASAHRITRSVSNRVDFIAGDLRRTPFAKGSFDWVWCADALWPGPEIDAPVSVVRELVRIIRPGGRLALIYWSNQSLLPGHPKLEANLNLAFAATTPYISDPPPERQFMRALGWLETVGVERPSARSYVAELKGPLSARQQEAVAFCCEMFWGKLEQHVSANDWSQYKRLCRDASDTCLFKKSDYYGYVIYTCFRGRIP